MPEEIKLVQHPTFTVIRKSEDYVADGLGKVTVMTAIDPAKAEAAKEPPALYMGYAVLGAQVGGTIRQFPVEWMIENVNSVEEAFAAFQKEAVEQLKKNMEEAQRRVEEERRRIITAPASAVQNMKIVT